jgi:hypothetical protein
MMFNGLQRVSRAFFQAYILEMGLKPTSMLEHLSVFFVGSQKSREGGQKCRPLKLDTQQLGDEIKMTTFFLFFFAVYQHSISIVDHC